MQFVAIHTNSTHIDPSRGQLIEIGAVVADSKNEFDPIGPLNTYHAYIVQDEFIVQPFAASAFAHVFSAIAKKTDPKNIFARFISPRDLASDFYAWLLEGNFGYAQGRGIVFAGQNYGMREFPALIQCCPDWETIIPHAPGQISYQTLYLRESDDVIPTRDECRRRAGFKQIEDKAKSACEYAIETAILVQRRLFKSKYE